MVFVRRVLFVNFHISTSLALAGRNLFIIQLLESSPEHHWPYLKVVCRSQLSRNTVLINVRLNYKIVVMSKENVLKNILFKIFQLQKHFYRV